MADIIKITDFNAPQLDAYARLSEKQLMHYNEPDLGFFIAESPKVIQRGLDVGHRPLSFLVEDKHIDTQAAEIIAQCGGVPVYTAEFDILTQLTGFELTRGMLAVMRRKELPSVKDICADMRRVVVLDKGKLSLDGTPKEVFSQVEKLHEMGLASPETVELCFALNQKGYELPLDKLNPEECAQVLFDWVKP